MHKTSPHLDGEYAAFGKIIEGMETVNAIAKTATNYADRPLQDQRIKTMTVDTFGVDYPEPEQTQRKIRPFTGYGVPFSGTPFFIV